MFFRLINCFAAGFCTFGTLICLSKGHAFGVAMGVLIVAANLSCAYVANRRPAP